MSIVTCKFEGRFANNILQTMAMIGYAKKYNCQWFIPRQYHHRDIFRLGLPLMRGGQKFKFYQDPWSDMIGYQEIPHFPKGVTLHGFFQSEKYFIHAKDEVYEAFKVLNNSSILRDNLSGVCSIHVRRGDYLQYPTRFSTPSIEYIYNAIEVMSRTTNRFMVFSDDIQWCKENFNFSGHFEFSEEQDPKNALTLMAHCEHNIICASSFGWVGAWLNRNENKTVIAPKKWFEWETRLTDKDIVPDNWIKI